MKGPRSLRLYFLADQGLAEGLGVYGLGWVYKGLTRVLWDALRFNKGLRGLSSGL